MIPSMKVVFDLTDNASQEIEKIVAWITFECYPWMYTDV